MGLKDQLIFPEIKYENVISTRGMNITICTSAKTDAEALALLTHVGMPFRKPRAEKADSKGNSAPEAAIA
jgi:large subunit ribosomal protein L5